MIRTVNSPLFNHPAAVKGTYRFVAPGLPVDLTPRKSNPVIFSRPPAHLGYGRPAQSSAGQP